MITDSFHMLQNDIAELQRNFKTLQIRLERAESIPYKIRSMVEKEVSQEELLAYLVPITPHGKDNTIS